MNTRTARCLNCGGSFGNEVAYLSGGALLLDESLENSIHLDQHQAFLHIGFHGKDIAVRDSADICLVDDRPGGHFDLSFCTIDCLEAWLLAKISQLRNELAENIARMNADTVEGESA